MRIEVATAAVAGAGDVVRRAADRLAAVEVPRAACTCGDLAADDAVRALVDVVSESMEDLARDLRATAVLLDVAVADYAKLEAHLSRRARSRG